MIRCDLVLPWDDDAASATDADADADADAVLFCSVLALNPPEYLPTDNKFGCKNGFTKRL